MTIPFVPEPTIGPRAILRRKIAQKEEEIARTLRERDRKKAQGESYIAALREVVALMDEEEARDER